MIQLTNYDKVMNLKIFINCDDEKLKNIYKEAATKHNKKIQDCPDIIDAGFDLYAPLQEDQNQKIFFSPANVNKLDFKIICSAQIKNQATNKTYNTGYYMYPRSSISKTRLRLANSVGIIDAGYRGHIMAMLDVIGSTDYQGTTYDRYIQICAPGLIPITVEIVDNIESLGEKTERGQGGFGSTGK
uniref:dUTP diphosphatase n=1 Tax=viral metagenome TaxID=1070528 RepID=A0A6C0IGK4_9ZZZZ